MVISRERRVGCFVCYMIVTPFVANDQSRVSEQLNIKAKNKTTMKAQKKLIQQTFRLVPLFLLIFPNLAPLTLAFWQPVVPCKQFIS